MTNDRSTFTTVIAVAMIVLLTFAGAALYDRLSGGPDARAASVSAERLLAFQVANLDRTLCVSDLTRAYNRASGELQTAIGEIVAYAFGHPDAPASARPDRLAADLQSAGVHLAVANARLALQPQICPAPEPPFDADP